MQARRRTRTIHKRYRGESRAWHAVCDGELHAQEYRPGTPPGRHRPGDDRHRPEDRPHHRGQRPEARPRRRARTPDPPDQPRRPDPARGDGRHGITDDDVADCPTFRAIAPALARYLDGCDLAGFKSSASTCGCSSPSTTGPGRPSRGGRAVIDACKIFHKREPRDLTAAYRIYCGREHEGATRRRPTWWRPGDPRRAGGPLRRPAGDDRRAARALRGPRLH